MERDSHFVVSVLHYEYSEGGKIILLTTLFSMCVHRDLLSLMSEKMLDV